MGAKNFAVEFVIRGKDDLSHKLDEVDKNIDKMCKKFEQSEQTKQTETSRTNKKIKETNKLLETGKRLLAGYFSLSFIKSSLNAYADFTKIASKIQAITHSSNEEMKVLGENLLNVKSTFSLSEIQHAGFIMSKNFNALDIGKHMQDVANFAMTTTSSMDDSAIAISDINTVYSKMGYNVKQTSDLVSLTIDKATIGLNDFTEAFKYAGPAGANFGIQLEEINALIGVFASQGLKGGLAGNRIKSMLQSLAIPSKKTQQLFKALGISSKDIDLKGGNLNKTLSLLDSKMSKLSENKKGEVMQAIFGAYGSDMSGVLSQMDLMKQKVDELRKAEGFAEKGAKGQLDTYYGAIKMLKTEISKFQIAIGENLAPVLTEFLKVLTPLIGSLGGLLRSFGAENTKKGIMAGGGAYAGAKIGGKVGSYFGLPGRGVGMAVGGLAGGLAGNIAQKDNTKLPAHLLDTQEEVSSKIKSFQFENLQQGQGQNIEITLKNETNNKMVKPEVKTNNSQKVQINTKDNSFNNYMN